MFFSVWLITWPPWCREHHGGPLDGHPETSQTITALLFWGVSGGTLLMYWNILPAVRRFLSNHDAMLSRFAQLWLDIPFSIHKKKSYINKVYVWLSYALFKAVSLKLIMPTIKEKYLSGTFIHELEVLELVLISNIDYENYYHEI